MANCNNCAAPLPTDSNRCCYCNVRNDIDLHGTSYSIEPGPSNRDCPHCKIPLQTLKIDENIAIQIEHCRQCFGVFFDPGELNVLLESSVSHVFEIDLSLIKEINRDRYQKEKMVKYIKCPTCNILMNRVNFAHHSGVVIDQCKQHGVWLDSGEIIHLQEWKKAGGEILNSKDKEKKRPNQKPTKQNISFDHKNFPLYKSSFEDDLLDSVSNLVFKLFK